MVFQLRSSCNGEFMSVKKFSGGQLAKTHGGIDVRAQRPEDFNADVGARMRGNFNGCQDIDGWSDSDGDTCDDYTSCNLGRPSKAPSYYKKFVRTRGRFKGVSALEACCACHDVTGEMTYVSGMKGTNTCTHGKIATESSCEAAANQLGVSYRGSERNSGWPGGCYMIGYPPQALFNKVNPGKANPGAWPICQDDMQGALADKYTVSGSTFQPTVNGLYRMTSKTVDGHPYYEKRSGPSSHPEIRVLYWQPILGGRWVIGDIPGGDIRVGEHDGASPSFGPPKIVGTRGGNKWMVVDKNEWHAEPSLSLRMGNTGSSKSRALEEASAKWILYNPEDLSDRSVVPNFGLGALRLTLPITNDWIGTTPSGFVEGLAGPSTQGLTQFSVQKVTKEGAEDLDYWGSCGFRDAGATYVFGVKGTNRCSGGKITSVSACADAMKQLSMAVGQWDAMGNLASQRESSWPGGCYWAVTAQCRGCGPRVFFNNAPGKAHSKATPICQETPKS